MDISPSLILLCYYFRLLWYSLTNLISIFVHGCCYTFYLHLFFWKGTTTRKKIESTNQAGSDLSGIFLSYWKLACRSRYVDFAKGLKNDLLCSILLDIYEASQVISFKIQSSELWWILWSCSGSTFKRFLLKSCPSYALPWKRASFWALLPTKSCWLGEEAAINGNICLSGNAYSISQTRWRQQLTLLFWHPSSQLHSQAT